MTRAEFIKLYCDKSGIEDESRRHWGFVCGGWKRYALPCHCGDKACHGWAMVSLESIDHHLEVCYWPDGAAPDSTA